MSRIGRKVIAIPKGVTITSKDGLLSIKGPKGQLAQQIPSEIGVKIEGETLSFSRSGDEARCMGFRARSPITWSRA